MPNTQVRSIYSSVGFSIRKRPAHLCYISVSLACGRISSIYILSSLCMMNNFFERTFASTFNCCYSISITNLDMMRSTKRWCLLLVAPTELGWAKSYQAYVSRTLSASMWSKQTARCGFLHACAWSGEERRPYNFNASDIQIPTDDLYQIP
jgi:hypothetical protein